MRAEYDSVYNSTVIMHPFVQLSPFFLFLISLKISHSRYLVPMYFPLFCGMLLYFTCMPSVKGIVSAFCFELKHFTFLHCILFSFLFPCLGIVFSFSFVLFRLYANLVLKMLNACQQTMCLCSLAVVAVTVLLTILLMGIHL